MQLEIYSPYAGVGARDTPMGIQCMMSELARDLAAAGFTLRSGGARGADGAFEDGADASEGKKEIYLPWEGFQGRSLRKECVDASRLPTAPQAAMLTALHHPKAHALSTQVRLFMNRNAHQVLGTRLNRPAWFLAFWSSSCRRDDSGRICDASGGTGQAVRIAYAHNISCYHLGEDGAERALREMYL